jgi:hypothetical protein
MPRWFRCIIVICIAAIATAAMAALWGINRFRADVRETAASSDNPGIAERAEQAIQYEQLIMFGILAVSILFTALSLGLFKRSQDQCSEKMAPQVYAAFPALFTCSRAKPAVEA